MNELTARELAREVLSIGPPGDGHDLERRVEALTALVLDLLVEVEALRKTQSADPAYRDAYRATCLLSHNSAGVTSGWEKLLACYYPGERAASGRLWRETIMMKRLGMTPAEIAAYQREADEAETYT